MNRALLVASTLCLLTACQPSGNKKDEAGAVTHILTGEWRNLDLTVELNKKYGVPSRVFRVNEETWEDSLQIRPIRTYFQADGKFNSEHYDLNDSLILNPAGTWSATDNSVTMITTEPFSDTTACEYTINGEIVSFGCWVDWDQDGDRDDWYYGTQKRYPSAKSDN